MEELVDSFKKKDWVGFRKSFRRVFSEVMTALFSIIVHLFYWHLIGVAFGFGLLRVFIIYNFGG